MGRIQKLRLTIGFDEPDGDGWIVARVAGVPGAISQGRTREEARENVIDGLRLVLTPEEANSSRCELVAVLDPSPDELIDPEPKAEEEHRAPEYRSRGAESNREVEQ